MPCAAKSFAAFFALAPVLSLRPPLGLHQSRVQSRVRLFLLLASGCDNECDAIWRTRRNALQVLGVGTGAVGFAQASWGTEEVEAHGTKAFQAGYDMNEQLANSVGLGTCCPCEIVEEYDAQEDESLLADSVCDATYQQVKAGLVEGYRFIDTASHYNNEISVGRAVADAVKAGIVARSDVLVCTKVWFDDLGYEKTLRAVAKSQTKLASGLRYGADLVLIHFPGGIGSVQSPAQNRKLRKESWQALEKLKNEGKILAIGVSNYVSRHMKELLSYATVKPDVVEMEFHPFNQQPDLVALCRENNIKVIGFSPLAHGDLPVLENQILMGIAEAYSKSVPQIVLRWMLQEGITPVVFTTKWDRLADNLKIKDFSLAESDMIKIRSLDAGKRVGFNPNLIA